MVQFHGEKRTLRFPCAMTFTKCHVPEKLPITNTQTESLQNLVEEKTSTLKQYDSQGRAFGGAIIIKRKRRQPH